MRFIYITFALFSMHTANCFASMTGYSVMKKVDQQSKQYKTQQSDVYMVITNKKGATRKRHFTNKKKNDTDSIKSIIKFYKPSSIKGTKLLTHSPKDSDENKQWIFLPAFRSTKNLTSSDKFGSFMGSDFSYLDVGGRQVGQDRHTLVKNDDKYYYVRSIPKNPEDPYSRIDSIIDARTFVPVKITFYNKKAQKLKTLTNNKIDKYGRIYIITQATMQNHLSKGNTFIEISDIRFGVNVPDTEVGIKGLN